MIYKLKKIREDAGLTQTELAEISGVSRMTIVKIENGNEKTATTTKTLDKLAKALNTTVDSIFCAD